MRVIHDAEEFHSSGRKTCLAIGMFDGVHLGHQQVLRQTVLDARQHSAHAVAVTFDRHPNSVVAPERTPMLIYSLPQKLREIDKLCIHAIRLLEFTPELSRVPAAEFVRALLRQFEQLQSICVGRDFTFGFKRSGNLELLKQLGNELDFQVHGVPALSLDGKIVSSTRIRQAIAAGDLEAASQMLGRPYAIEGKVVQGDQLGRKIGFPTANIAHDSLITPPFGVYAVQVRWDQSTFPGVVNIGVRPTIAEKNPPLRVEVYLIGFEGDLYGHQLELTFLGTIRPERKFATLEELKKQIAVDIESARKFFV